MGLQKAAGVQGGLDGRHGAVGARQKAWGASMEGARWSIGGCRGHQKAWGRPGGRRGSRKWTIYYTDCY